MIIKPAIYDISLDNITTIETGFGNKRVKGDIYYKGTYIGYYDPLYQEKPEDRAKVYFRIEKKYENIAKQYDNYQSILTIKGLEDTSEEVVKGLKSLLLDLEILNWLSVFITDYCNNEEENHKKRIKKAKKTGIELPEIPYKDDEFRGITGIINNKNVKAIQIKDVEQMNKSQIRKFIEKNVESFSLDKENPILIFRKPEDFIIKKCVLYA